ncbi:nudix hydrolase 17, mitochondrial-like [Tasmannia lanceolata]|uniref:nudix hydrolase 17, mitochondrial-like n=1 Tax=Tasmannia lanceolata TaxID=3420 RepID=UPI004063B10D
MVALVARTGRQLQRYNQSGGRLVVGCIPYRFKLEKSLSNGVEQALEVLVITTRNGRGLLFPKGGWESDESIIQAAKREALEEAGVHGEIKHKLGKWSFKSKSQDIFREGHMFPLLVTEQLDLWPEKDARQRKWVTVMEAKEHCPYQWMKEALDKLVNRLPNLAGELHHHTHNCRGEITTN